MTCSVAAPVVSFGGHVRDGRGCGRRSRRPSSSEGPTSGVARWWAASGSACTVVRLATGRPRQGVAAGLDRSGPDSTARSLRFMRRRYRGRLI
jgi:hypothetical protein